MLCRASSAQLPGAFFRLLISPACVHHKVLCRHIGQSCLSGRDGSSVAWISDPSLQNISTSDLGAVACRNAIVFLTLYLQLLGMNDAAASALMALFLGGSALGGLLGGYLGDKAAQVRSCAATPAISRSKYNPA